MPRFSREEQCWVRMVRLLLKQKPATRRGGMRGLRHGAAAASAGSLTLKEALLRFGVPVMPLQVTIKDQESGPEWCSMTRTHVLEPDYWSLNIDPITREHMRIVRADMHQELLLRKQERLKKVLCTCCLPRCCGSCCV